MKNKNSKSVRNWNKNFIEYMQFIVNHKNYSSMPDKFKVNGEINWVSPSNNNRAIWWDEKKQKLHFNSRAEVARYIHPKKLNGYKPCQICGKNLSIFYVYPTKNMLKKINKYLKVEIKPFEKEIIEILHLLQDQYKEKTFDVLKYIFNIPNNINQNIQTYAKYILENKKLSPGVMSNAPDRLDGFHTYNACCRGREDTGRHKTNLSRYTQDRRAYENWADGDWNLSNRLMGEYGKYQNEEKCESCNKKRKLTADHIGPISLGFAHRPKFQSLCKSCNSKKNNRMDFNDIKILLEDERNNQKVISWHSKYLWNKLKNKINSDRDALKLSKLMRIHLNNILLIFSEIYKDYGKEFLKKYLHEEYSFYDYKFENFHPLKIDQLVTKKKPLNSKNKRKNADRYLRISFESLAKYQETNNRNTKIIKNANIIDKKDILFSEIKNNQYTKARKTLNKLIILISEAISKDF